MYVGLLAYLACFRAVAAATQRPWLECLNNEIAENIVGRFRSILEHTNITTANDTAQTLLADNYQEVSDSILSLEGLPLGQVTFADKQAYIDGVLHAPPIQGIETVEVLVAGCDKILWYWNFTGIGNSKYNVKGFNLFAISDKKQIERINLEFNSIAWGLDTGLQIIRPPATNTTKGRNQTERY